MKELEYLSKQAKYSLIAPSPKQAISVKPETILAIAEAFRALEQRAEAAEARLAELEKQEPAEYQYYYHNHGTGAGQWLPVNRKQAFEQMKAKHAGDNDFSFRELFTRPAPAINLAELVPDEATDSQFDGLSISKAKGWNDCRAAILRNIGEVKSESK